MKPMPNNNKKMQQVMQRMTINFSKLREDMQKLSEHCRRLSPTTTGFSQESPRI